MKKKQLFLLLALTCLFVQGAWADDATVFGGGDGAAKTPYIISSEDHWNQLSTNVAAGNDYDGKYFQLDADITVSSMLGTGTTAKNARPFKGIFDGNGYTLTFNHVSATAENDIAPFRFVSNATIKNLHVDGTITTANRHSAGLVGRAYRTTLIQNCRVSTTIISSVSGDGTHGGFVAIKPNYDSAKLTIDGCVFDGKILTTNGTTLCGGFVGYTSYGSLTIKNSIYAPAAPADGETAVSDGATFYRYDANHQGTITLTNAYYTQTLGTAQGQQAHSITFDGTWDIDIVPTGTATEYDMSGITVYEGSPCLKLDGTLYAASGSGLTLRFVHNYVGSTLTYKKDGAQLSGNDTDGYAVTMPAQGDLVLTVAYTGPQPVNLPGDGTQGTPYQIGSKETWDYIVGMVNAGTGNYPSAYYQLTADISVTTMMGTTSNLFKGHFDGNGHTLTVNYNTSEQDTAPFRYVQGAVISNLHVAGAITTSKKFAGGLIARCIGATITNCRVSVNMNSSVIGDGTHGGFVAINVGGTLTITGSAFDGSMLGSRTINCAGLVGWNEVKDANIGHVNIDHCLFIAQATSMRMEKTFVRSRYYQMGSNIYVTISNSYCITDYGDNQQARIYRIMSNENVRMSYAGSAATHSYSVSGIDFYSVGLKFDGVLYAQSGDQIQLNLEHIGTPPEHYEYKGIATTTGTLAGIEGETNGYTLTMANADANIYAKYEVTVYDWKHGGSGTADAPYIISTSAAWDDFALYVNLGMSSYPTAYYQLGDDITVETMAGNDVNKFRGHFDGNGKTLTLNYGTADVPVSEDYCAPFRYVDDADIHDLIVAGNIYTSAQFAAGIAGHAVGNNTIDNCRSSVTIDSSVNGDGTHGGFVANIQGGTTNISNSAFNGGLLGSTTKQCGGFVGWAERNKNAIVKFNTCLFAPTEIGISNDGCATFSRNNGSGTSVATITNCYYIRSLGTAQGSLAYASPLSDRPSEKLTIAGVDCYVERPLIRNISVNDITANGATIGWDAAEGVTCSLRYSENKKVEVTDFRDGLPTGWTTIDADGDGYNWKSYTDDDLGHGDDTCMGSASYDEDDDKGLSPDNWLVSPQLTLGGTLSVWIKAMNPDYTDEHFAIYLSTTGNAKADFTVTLLRETVAAGEWRQYSADLSNYKEQTGYIAIRHFNCTDEWVLLVDDFSLLENEWTTVPATTTGITLSGLKEKTEYNYHVVYAYQNETYNSTIGSFTTIDEMAKPAALTVGAVTANTATVSWKGYTPNYNLRYAENNGQPLAQVTLNIPDDVWDDGSGFQMLFDKDHTIYGDDIDEIEGEVEENEYSEFEYKIPENADGNLNTTNIVLKNSKTIFIPAGTYDWFITNPTPDDCVYIVHFENGNTRGRYDDFVFEAGKHYTFTVLGIDEGRVDMTVGDMEDPTEGSDLTWTTISNTTSSSYTLESLSASKGYIVQVQGVKDDEQSPWATAYFTTADPANIELSDNADNSSIIAANDGQECNVTLVGRTLYKDGDWKTLCLPFDVTIDENSPLAGGTAMTLYAETCNFSGNTLTLNFTEATTIAAGTPFIIKWEGDGTSNITEPVFTGVTIHKEPNNVTVTGVLTFTGTYKPVSVGTDGDPSMLYLGASNTLYYPNGEMTIGCQQAYFQLADGLTAGEPTSPGQIGIRAFELNFEGEASGIASGIAEIHSSIFTRRSSLQEWYSLDGRRLNGKPTQGGVYLFNGRKVVVK